MKRFGKTVWLAGFSMLALTFGSAVVTAADMSKAIQYRQNVMKSNGANAADIGLMLKGEVPFSKDRVIAHATAINAMAKIIPELFPAGSDVGNTKAKPELWQHMDEVKTISSRLETESAKLIEVAKSGDQKAVGAQMAAMGKEGCGACHKKFRKPEKNAAK